MNVNWGSVVQHIPALVGVAMDTAERIHGPKKGPEKEATAVGSVLSDLATRFSAADVVADPALAELLKQYIAARKSLENWLSAKAAVGAQP